MIKAWCFLDNNDPRISNKEWMVSTENVKLGGGFRAYKSIIYALAYADGPIVCRVGILGKIEEHENYDRLLYTEEKMFWWVDVSELLLQFSRQCALEVSYMCDFPRLVMEYLRTGNESIRRESRKITNDIANSLDPSSSAQYAAFSAALASDRYDDYRVECRNIISVYNWNLTSKAVISSIAAIAAENKWKENIRDNLWKKRENEIKEMILKEKIKNIGLGISFKFSKK